MVAGRRPQDFNVVSASGFCLWRKLFVVDSDLMFAFDRDIHDRIKLGVDQGERMIAVRLS